MSLANRGCVPYQGAILDEVPSDDQPSSLKFCGSTIIAIAETKDEIMDVLKNDVYARTGVWDLEKVWNATKPVRQAGH
jgi:uncharacterized protein